MYWDLWMKDYLIFAIFLIFCVTQALTQLQILAPCGFLVFGHAARHPKANISFCYFPVSRNFNHAMYQGWRFLHWGFPTVFSKRYFVGYDEHAKACSLFDADLFTAEDQLELDFIHDNKYIPRGTRFLAKYRFYKDGRLIFGLAPDAAYIGSLLRTQKIRCEEPEIADCCIAVEARGKNYIAILTSCHKFTSQTVICKMITEKFIIDTAQRLLPITESTIPDMSWEYTASYEVDEEEQENERLFIAVSSFVAIALIAFGASLFVLRQKQKESKQQQLLKSVGESTEGGEEADYEDNESESPPVKHSKAEEYTETKTQKRSSYTPVKQPRER